MEKGYVDNINSFPWKEVINDEFLNLLKTKASKRKIYGFIYLLFIVTYP